MTTKKQTLRSIGLLQLAYQNDMPDERLEFYVEALKDIPIAALQASVMYCINHCYKLPSIAEIREAAEQAVALAEGTHDENSAATAWGRVQKAIAAVGYTGRPDFSDDPVLADVVDHLGWKEICMTPTDDTAILRAQFRKAYEAGCRKRKDVRDFSQAGVPINQRIKRELAASVTRAALPGGHHDDFS